MEAIDKIKNLQQVQHEIQNLVYKLIPKWKADPKTYDKVRFGFMSGDTDGWYKDQEQIITFQAWCGTYGDSSTYQQFTPHGDIFKRHFLKFLNDNKFEILEAIENNIIGEILTLKEEAKNELEAELKNITDL